MSILETPIQWKTKTEMIYHILREAIVSGELKPGERIILRKIASDLGVSAIPVREAVKLLEAECLVDLSAYSEVTVSRFSEKDYRELFEVRILLESYAARRVVERLNEEFIQELDQIIAEMRICVNKEDYKGYGILNRSFHQTINAFSDNDQLRKMIDQVNAKTDRARALFVYSPQRTKESLMGHENIVKAFKQGDVETAVKIIEEESRTGFELFLKHYEMEKSNEE